MSPTNIKIFDQQFEVVHDLAYLGSTITDSLSLDSELNERIGKTATSK